MKKNTEPLTDASREAGLETYVEKIKYMLLCCLFARIQVKIVT
jgi:hypothetical protein